MVSKTTVKALFQYSTIYKYWRNVHLKHFIIVVTMGKYSPPPLTVVPGARKFIKNPTTLLTIGTATKYLFLISKEIAKRKTKVKTLINDVTLFPPAMTNAIIDDSKTNTLLFFHYCQTYILL